MTTAQESAALKGACCSTWTNPIARLLLGERLHPGGERTTTLAVEALRLPPGATVLDLGCGFGGGLATLASLGYLGIGLELAPEAASGASEVGAVVIGDAERPPMRSGSVDGIVIECVLSLLPDKRSALTNAYEILRPGGRIALSDVVVEQPLPLPLGGLAAWSACVGGALRAADYVALLEETGFRNVESVCLDEELIDLIGQLRRRISLIEITLTAGGVKLASLGLNAELLEVARGLAGTAADFVRSGGAGYRLIHAGR
jgi:SAM-dependent methyltransferase